MISEARLDRAMRRALELAKFGPADNENPQVGCVIVAPDGLFVAEGWHEGAGTPHAEVVALSRIPDDWRERVDELTAVVTLEPCNHHGRTGPCAVALIDAGIRSVVYSLSDPGDASSGGAVRLAEAGVTLRSGFLASETKVLLKPWLGRYAAAHPADRPRITVKWAQSLDGRIAAADGTSQWITNDQSRRDVHERRAAADGILVGTGTLLADNPALTAREDDGSLLPSQPRPVVMGQRAIPADARIWEHPALGPDDEPLTISGRNLPAELKWLADQGIRSLFVEGGASIISTLLTAELVDELLIYTAPMLLGGPNVAIADLGIHTLTEASHFDITEISRFGSDTLVIAKTRR